MKQQVKSRMWILTTDDAAVDPPVVIRLATGAERTVGRANRSDFILDAALVSRVHCRLSTDARGDLSVEDLEAAQAAVVEAGGIVTRAIFSFPDGRRFHFADPSGNELGVWSEK